MLKNGISYEINSNDKICGKCGEDIKAETVLVYAFRYRGTQGAQSQYYHIECSKKCFEQAKRKGKRLTGESYVKSDRIYRLTCGRSHQTSVVLLPDSFDPFINIAEEERLIRAFKFGNPETKTNAILKMTDQQIVDFSLKKRKASIINNRKIKQDKIKTLTSFTQEEFKKMLLVAETRFNIGKYSYSIDFKVRIKKYRFQVVLNLINLKLITMGISGFNIADQDKVSRRIGNFDINTADMDQILLKHAVDQEKLGELKESEQLAVLLLSPNSYFRELAKRLGEGNMA